MSTGFSQINNVVLSFKEFLSLRRRMENPHPVYQPTVTVNDIYKRTLRNISPAGTHGTIHKDSFQTNSSSKGDYDYVWSYARQHGTKE